MPKIPTYTSKGRITAEPTGVQANIKISPTASIAAGLLPAAEAIEEYHIKQRDNNEKLQARKTFYEMKSESDEIIKKYKLEYDEVGYIGDDINDLPAMQKVGFKGAPADAVAEVKSIADFISYAKGGEGAVREFIECILKSQGLWQKVLRNYQFVGRITGSKDKKVVDDTSSKT